MRKLALVFALLLLIPAIGFADGWPFVPDPDDSTLVKPAGGKGLSAESVVIGGANALTEIAEAYDFADATARDAYFDGDPGPATPDDGTRIHLQSTGFIQQYVTGTGWVNMTALTKGPAGAAGADGADGADGSAGADGADAFVYIAYASDDSGTGFTTTFNAALDYIAVLATDSEIASPAVGDFAGLWKKYKGDDGADGADGSDGLPGAGVSWEGEYNGATTYSANDAVEYNGSSYIASDTTTGDVPGVDAVWVLWVEKGDTGSAGADGADGADGASAFVYIAYASDASGTGFTTTYNSELDYIAILATDTEIPSPAVGDFAGLWKNYKGATGETGETGSAGADGSDGADGTDAGPWVTGVGYSTDAIVANDGVIYVCTSGHTSGSTTEPGVGASWETVWDEFTGGGTDTIGWDYTALSSAPGSPVAGKVYRCDGAASGGWDPLTYNPDGDADRDYFVLYTGSGYVGIVDIAGNLLIDSIPTSALDVAANVKSILDADDYAGIRLLLGLVIGTNVQAYDSDLTTWAGVTPSSDGQLFVALANYAAMFGAIKQAATTSATGVMEIATTAETSAGNDAGRAVTPDGLSGSPYGQKEIGWTVYDSDADTAVADGLQAAVVPASMNGMNLVDLTCSVHDLNSAASGTTTVVLRRVRGATAVDMTSTGVTIGYNEYTASDETVNTSNDDVQTGDKIYVDVNGVTTAVQKGLSCTAIFQTP